MANRLSHTAARLLRMVPFVAVLGGLGGLAFWTWQEGQIEREREATRELSIKEPPRRFIDPKTQEIVIQLDRETQRRLGLVTESLQPSKWQRTLKLLGYTVVVPQRLTEVRSPWTGVLEAPSTAPIPTVGQEMSKGQLLGNLLVQWNPSDRIQLETQMRDARGTITETESQIHVAKSTVERLRKIDGHVVAGKLLIEAEGNLAQLEARLGAAKEREKDRQEALSQTATEFRFRLTAPQNGQLTELNGRPGEVVSAGSIVATIYDPQELWITATVLPSTPPLTEIPNEAQITFPGFVAKPLSARLVRVKPQIAPPQQGLELVYGTANPGGLIPVGLQAQALIRVGQLKDVVRVPQSAVVQLNNRRLVYLQRAPEEFVKQFVEVEGEDGGVAYLQSALPEGGKVVVRGAQCLLSEEYKESIQLVEEGAKDRTPESGKPQEK